MVKFDNKLTFDGHISELMHVINAIRKVRALAKVTPYMNISKRRILMNSFFTSQFSYCLLIWICGSRINNRKINSIHERCLRIIYQDKQSSLEQLFKKDNSVSIHQRNLHSLATEINKISNCLSLS